jgi:hypothetical protein
MGLFENLKHVTLESYNLEPHYDQDCYTCIGSIDPIWMLTYYDFP